MLRMYNSKSGPVKIVSWTCNWKKFYIFKMLSVDIKQLKLKNFLKKNYERNWKKNSLKILNRNNQQIYHVSIKLRLWDYLEMAGHIKKHFKILKFSIELENLKKNFFCERF